MESGLPPSGVSFQLGTSGWRRRRAEYEVQTLFDDERDHYQLLYVGWRGTKRDFGCILHLDIKNGKIWIQHDGTEEGIANQLVALGVPRQDIVLAFHEPEVRNLTDFGTGDTSSSRLVQSGY